MDLAQTAQLCRVLGDSNRLRLLALLDHEQLTVAELTRITQLGQSSTSTHLKRLRQAGLVRGRPAGSATYYALSPDMPDVAGGWWRFVRGQADDPLFQGDRARLTEVLQARAGVSWADSVAGRMSRYYSPGRTWAAFARGLVGLIDLGDVLDVASGDGALAELLAPQARSVTCLDRAPRVVRSGHERLAATGNVRFMRGDMHALPFADRRFDAVMLLSALCHATAPDVAVAEAARVVAPGGRLVMVTLKTHAHAAAVSAFGHIQLGFEPEWLREQMTRAGLEVALCEVTQRERRAPHFEVLTVHARRPK